MAVAPIRTFTSDLWHAARKRNAAATSKDFIAETAVSHAEICLRCGYDATQMDCRRYRRRVGSRGGAALQEGHLFGRFRARHGTRRDVPARKRSEFRLDRTAAGRGPHGTWRYQATGRGSRPGDRKSLGFSALVEVSTE